jgi:hypothetical protein
MVTKNKFTLWPNHLTDSNTVVYEMKALWKSFGPTYF